MKDGQSYFVGVGAMKAGTTWLHDYFEGRNDVFVPKMKELHYFNVRFRPGMSKSRHRRIYTDVSSSTTACAEGAPEANEELMWEHVDRLMMERDPSAYREFFLRRIQDKHKVFGEITPAYSLLREDGMASIKEQFPAARAILLLRDPVSRYVSQLRFTNNSSRFAQFLDHPGFIQRGAYDVIWKNLRTAFSKEDIYVGFYESLFKDETISEICDFLGLTFQPANYGRRVNPSRTSLKLTPEQELQARKKFRTVYEFCEEKFGSRVPDSWLGAA